MPPEHARCARLNYSTTPTSRCEDEALEGSCFCEHHQPGKPAGVQTDLDLPTDRIFVPPLDVQVGGNHYKDFPIQPVEFIEMNGFPYCIGNAIKYVVRHRLKHGREDLEKAKHYCELGCDLYAKMRRHFVRNTPDEWNILPTVFVHANKIDGHARESIMHLCSVYTVGMMGYLRAKNEIELLIQEEHRS
jgi:hypothetical protein